jgi:hypothetical protein
MEAGVLLIEFCDEQLALGSKRRTKFQLDGFADLGSEGTGKLWVIQQFRVSESAVCKTTPHVIYTIHLCIEKNTFVKGSRTTNKL